MIIMRRHLVVPP